MARNPLIRKAFEEAAKREIEKLPKEENIIRPYSDEFNEKMEELLRVKESSPKRKFRFGRIAAVAAVLAVMLTFTSSALLKGDSIWKLLNFEPDPEKYETIEIKADSLVKKENDYDTLSYIGEPITLKYTVDTGESWEWPDKGIMIFLDGVRQTFDARVNGEEHKSIDMLHLQNEPGTVKSIEFTFEPNIGNKGDEMYLNVMAIFDPEVDYYPQCNSKNKQLFVGHADADNDSICDDCSVNIDEIPSGPSSYTRHNETIIRVIMEKDAPSKTAIADSFSGIKVDELDKRIYKSYEYEDSFENIHNDYDTMQGVVASVYKKIKDSYIREWGVDCHATRIKTKAKENDEFTVNLHGATGKYRVSLYINNEIQSVFDGAAYADVDVVHGQQTELVFDLDTTKLPEGDNYCYVILQRLDGEDNISHWLDCFGLDYIIEVK